MEASRGVPALGQSEKNQSQKKRRTRLITAIVILFHILGLISSVHAIMSTRTSQGAIAWAVSLNTFPYLAVPAYWVLGRSRFQGYVNARHEGEEAVEYLTGQVVTTSSEFRVPKDGISPAARAAEGLGGIPFLKGNSIDLLIDGEATFDSILEGIDAAEEYILFQFFIVKDDGLGRRVKEHLVAKAKAGVRVLFLYDEVGSNKLPKGYKQELRDAGADVRAFYSTKGPGNRFQVNFRNHRKIVVVDGEVAWIGGHNVGDEYLGLDPEFGHWRDTHVRITGPAALAVQFSFVEDWYWASEQVPQLDWTPQASSDGDIPVLIVPSGPADDLETASLMFVHAINSARERIWIASPYFVPDEAVMTALQLAGLRGVDVRILIPDTPDHVLVYLAAYSYLDDASSTGVKIYRYLEGFLHQKTMLIDDVAAAIGTANFDNRSFRLNFEITALIGDPQFAAEVERMFQDDFSKSRLMQPGEYDQKSFPFKLAVRLARLTAPIL